MAALQRRPHIVIATPGRLLDLLDASEVDLGATLCGIRGATPSLCVCDCRAFYAEGTTICIYMLVSCRSGEVQLVAACD